MRTTRPQVVLTVLVWCFCGAWIAGCGQSPASSEPDAAASNDAAAPQDAAPRHDADADVVADIDASVPTTTPSVPVAPIREVPGAVFPAPETPCTERVSFQRDAATGAEAGFLATSSGRMFYAAQPYRGEDPNAPLLVIFNGGPGSPTTSNLFASGSGERAVVWENAAQSAPIDNPAAWTRFGHLLYLDAPGTGYSYVTRSEAGYAMTDETDAADFVTATLAFLGCRMDRPDRGVVLVGESYGGHRSFLMLALLHQFRDYEGLGEHWTAADAAALQASVREHFERVIAGRGESLAPDAHEGIARQFFGQVLIQPALLLKNEWPPPFWNHPDALARHPTPVRSATGDRTVVAVTDRKDVESMFAVPLQDIAWMDRAALLPPAPPGSEVEPHYLDTLLGSLPAGHSYFLPRGQVLALDDVQHPLRYDAGLRWSAVWISDAHGDHQVYTPAVMEYLVEEGAVQSVALEEGAWDLELLDGTERRWEVVELESAGHQIPHYQPTQSAAAIESWLARVMAVEP